MVLLLPLPADEHDRQAFHAVHIAVESCALVTEAGVSGVGMNACTRRYKQTCVKCRCRYSAWFRYSIYVCFMR